jgi:basic membrane protein A and related proteins
MASETGTVGFVGGMDIPLIRKFACGYAQGVKAVNPDATVDHRQHDRHHARRLERPGEGGRADPRPDQPGRRRGLRRRGRHRPWRAQAAADAGIFSIGVDSNQNYLHPGSVLTSMLKRVDVAVFDAMSAGADLETGVMVLGLAEEGVGYALDEHNAALITAEMRTAIDAAREQIIAGDLAVHDYSTDDTCPALTF